MKQRIMILIDEGTSREIERRRRARPLDARTPSFGAVVRELIKRGIDADATVPAIAPAKVVA